MLPSLEYIKTVINGLKKHTENKTESVRKDLENKVDSLPQPDWNQNDETAKDYVKNRFGGYSYTSGRYEGYGISGFLTASKMGSIENFTSIIFRGITYYDTPIDKSGSPRYSITVGGYTFTVHMVQMYCTINPSDASEDEFYFYYEQIEDSKIPKKYLPYIQLSDIKDTNILNGSAKGSLRTIGTATDSDDYTIGNHAFAEGNKTEASGISSHAEGTRSKARGDYSHAEGYQTEASNSYSHAEGSNTTASGDNSHTEGHATTASGYSSHAEGASTTASGDNSHTEGRATTASGYSSHAEGSYTTASGHSSHAEGSQTIATHVAQHVEGEYNIADSSSNSASERGNYIHIAGNGTFRDERSNAHTLDWDGNGWFAGDVYVGSTSGTNKDDGSKKLATEAYVNENITQSIPKIESLDKTNVKFLRDLEDGTYILQGYFKPYTGANSSFIFDPPALVSISSTGSETHVQIFEAHNNQIQHLVITDTSCETTYVFLNKIGNLSALKTTAKDTLVNAINETASAIPAVTSSDNGKFLQVVDGAWTAADGNSSSDVSLGITEAYKGYGIRVKAIDENNRPTEWEAVDEQPIPLHMSNSDGTIIRFCAVPVETLTPTSAYELAKSCLKSANAKLWYPEGPLNALILTVSEDDTNIYAWYISKDGTVKSVVTPKSIFTATE